MGLQMAFVSSWLALVLLLLGYVIYNAWLHPLARFPGPRWAGILPIWSMRAWIGGRYVWAIRDLHDEYGPVVRTSPNQISFCSPTSWKDIYGFTPGRKAFLKGSFYEPMPGTIRNLVSAAEPRQHAAMRKTLSHGFSASALNTQEDLIHHYVDMLVRKIHECNGNVGNVCKWYSFTTFDIIGQLSFGEPFGSLETGRSHYWIESFFDGAWALTVLRVFEYLPTPLRSLFRKLWAAGLLPRALIGPEVKQSQYGRDKVIKRLESDPQRTDFLTKMIAEREKNGTSLQELTVQATMLVRAGSETSATTMSAITYLLCRNAGAYDKLTHEIRGSFSSYSQINGHSVNSLPYLNAVIEEGLRLYPPFAFGLPRVSPGETVDGLFVPPGAIVYVSLWAATHVDKNFHQPFEFIPERWIDPACKDAKTASQPFSIGNRACLGRNLALLDLRLMLSKILWTFDVKMLDENLDWVEQSKSYVSWQKPELQVQFFPRSIES